MITKAILLHQSVSQSAISKTQLERHHKSENRMQFFFINFIITGRLSSPTAGCAWFILGYLLYSPIAV